MLDWQYFKKNTLVSLRRKILLHFVRNKTSRFLFLLTIACLFLTFVVEDVLKQTENICLSDHFSEWTEISAPGQIRSVRVTSYNKSNLQSKRKLILLWTKYFSKVFSEDYYFFQEGQATFDRYGCEINNCYITANKSLLPVADAVLFHARDFNDSDIPQRQNDKQIWIIYSMEPPRYMYLKWKLVRSLFNWSMTYRSDSHVQVKYGEVVLFNNSCRSFDEADLSTKKERAVWMVSNCRTESKREAYVKELRKYYKVDIYGQCSRHLKCVPPQSSKCYNLLKKYKYYLSFENSLCQDYVTEKFFNILHYDIVPIVFGGVNYSDIIPSGSFIDATEFPDPKDLASHLKNIARNSTQYESFFKWKKHYSVHLHPWMCDLCKRLHNSTNLELPDNLWKWWIKNASCRKWKKRKGFENILKNL